MWRGTWLEIWCCLGSGGGLEVVMELEVELRV